MKLCIICGVLLLVWPLEIDSCGKKGSSTPPEVSINGLKGNQIPPRDSGFFDQFQKCGVVNKCNRKNGFACPPARRRRRGKRSVLRGPRQRNGTRYFHQGEDYVKGGTDQADFKLPWVGRLDYKEDQAWWNPLPADSGLCTVSLISSRHVITASHCITDNGYNVGYDSKLTIKKKEMRVVFGSTTDDKMAFSYFVKEVYIPPKLPSPQSPHDLAVLRIDEVQLSEKLRPICLPVYGLPFGIFKHGINVVGVDFAGYGLAGVYPTRPGVYNRKHWQSHLQLLQNLVLISNQRSVQKQLNRESFIMASIKRGPREVCTGDSGGPLMWKNPANGRYIILGALKSSPSKCLSDKDVPLHDAKFSRVDDLLPDILDYMKGGRNNLCMDKDCKRDSTQIVKRTWLAKISGYPGQRDLYQTLNSPCFYQEGVGLGRAKLEPAYVCAVGGHRSIDIPYGRGSTNIMVKGGPTGDVTAFRTCKPCGKDRKGNDKPQDWDSSHFLDEITSGSMSQPGYKGIDTPPITPDNFPDRENHLSYVDVCDTKVNEENEILTCPEVPYTGGAHKCLLAENICDGITDCHGGWDESPHTCLGKCDFYHQYQYSQYVYKKTKGAITINVDSAKKCHALCLDFDSCSHFSWLDNKYTPDRCTILSGILSTNVRAFTEPTQSNLLAVRGPVMCGRRDNQNRLFDCKPTVGPPYRSGIFFIQSKTGHFLNRYPGSSNVNLAATVYNKIARKNYYGKQIAFDGSDEHEYLNGGEWIMEFTSDTNMEDSYFVIRSGVEGGQHSTQYLTAYLGSVNVTTRIGVRTNFGDGYKTNQRWHIEQTAAQQGFLEVKIWTKLLHKKWYLTSDATYDNDDGNNFDSQNTVSASTLKLLSEDNQQNINGNRQVFRLFECNHGLDTGVEIRGIKRNLHDKPVYDIKAMLLKATAGLDAQTKINVEEGILRQVFGITHTRYEASKMQNDDFDNLVDTIDEAFAASESLLDYAGRMRIPDSDYRKLRTSWITNVSAAKSTLSHGQDFYDMCKKLIRLNFVY